MKNLLHVGPDRNTKNDILKYFHDEWEDKFHSNFGIIYNINYYSTYANESLTFLVRFNYRTGKLRLVVIIGNEIVDSYINFDIANDNRVKDFIE